MEDHELTDSLEEGFSPVPVAQSECGASVALCVVVRKKRDPASGHFVLLRRVEGGRVLLGCLRDGGGRIVEWVELWLQTCDAVGDSVADGNAACEEAWTQLARAMQAADPEAHFRTAAESSPMLPAFIDLAAMAPWHPTREGKPLVVCDDDVALGARSLPKYSLTAARFAWVKGEPQGFIALNDAALAVPGSQGLDLPRKDDLVPLNPAGGRMIVRLLAPFASVDFAALIAGQPWRGAEAALQHCRLNRAYRLVSDASQMRYAGRHYFSSRSGAAGRLVEALHLKLQLAAQCFDLVRDYVRRRQLPLLTITAESFRVRLGNTGLQLPLFWTSRVMLVRSGDAEAVPVPNTQARYFRPRQALMESIYWPKELTGARRGTAVVRLRNMLPPAEDGIVVEGTIASAQELKAELNELVQIALPLADGTLMLWGYLDPNLAMAPGESGFRTIPLRLTPPQASALRGALGVVFPEVPIDVQVPLSTPCDLYSLGVITLQFLFAGTAITLPQAKDYLYSLARAISADPAAKEDLAVAICALIANDPRWLEGLGPQFLVASGMTAADAIALVPLQVWSRVLATLLKILPGRSPFAFCSDFGDAPPLALHAVFDRPIESLQGLLRLTRSMHVMDWTQNREIAGVVAGWMQTV